MLCSFLLCSRVNQPYVYIYPLFLGFPPHLGHQRGLFPVLYSRFSLAIYFIHSSVYMSAPIPPFISPSSHLLFLPPIVKFFVEAASEVQPLLEAGLLDDSSLCPTAELPRALHCRRALVFLPHSGSHPLLEANRDPSSPFLALAETLPRFS